MDQRMKVVIFVKLDDQCLNAISDEHMAASNC